MAVDKDPRACYFKQVLNGKYMRMALILRLLEGMEEAPAPEEEHGRARVVPQQDSSVKPQLNLSGTGRFYFKHSFVYSVYSLYQASFPSP